VADGVDVLRKGFGPPPRILRAMVREVEYAYDALQNELRGDVTWMRSKESMVAYHFILFLALHLYSQVLDHLKRKKMLSTYSVRDVLTYLSKVDVVEVNGKDHLLPVTKQT